MLIITVCDYTTNCYPLWCSCDHTEAVNISPGDNGAAFGAICTVALDWCRIFLVSFRSPRYTNAMHHALRGHNADNASQLALQAPLLGAMSKVICPRRGAMLSGHAFPSN